MSGAETQTRTEALIKLSVKQRKNSCLPFLLQHNTSVSLAHLQTHKQNTPQRPPPIDLTCFLFTRTQTKPQRVQ